MFSQVREPRPALFEVEDDENVHGGSEVNHMALRLARAIMKKSKRHLKMPASKSTAEKTIRTASTSAIRTAITCSY
jgi:hypothetical protein